MSTRRMAGQRGEGPVRRGKVPRRPATDYDSPWKEALDRYFERCMALFFPRAHADIDWTRGYEMLDKELQPIVRQSKQGRRYVDKLVKVWLRSGEERWLLIHVEVQTWKEDDFPRRMHVYNHRIFDRYDREVISLAILADDDPDWRPNQYEYGRWGFRTATEFPIVKLLDYAANEQALETDPNPFAVVVLAAPQDPGDASVADRPAGLETAAGQGVVRARDGCGRRTAIVTIHWLDHGSAPGAGTTFPRRNHRVSAGEAYAFHRHF